MTNQVSMENIDQRNQKEKREPLYREGCRVAENDKFIKPRKKSRAKLRKFGRTPDVREKKKKEKTCEGLCNYGTLREV